LRQQRESEEPANLTMKRKNYTVFTSARNSLAAMDVFIFQYVAQPSGIGLRRAIVKAEKKNPIPAEERLTRRQGTER
jgi:hypothetical protein